MAYFEEHTSIFEDLQCPGCKNYLDNLKVLPCSHPFCYDCLLHVAVSLAGRLKCLTCERVHRLPVGGVPAIPDIRPWLGQARSHGSYTSQDTGSLVGSKVRSPLQSDSSQIQYQRSSRNEDQDGEKIYRESLRSKTEKIYGSQNTVKSSSEPRQMSWMQNNASEHSCSLCNGVAVAFCNHCRQQLCKECRAEHKMKEGYWDHDVITLKDKRPARVRNFDSQMCPMHPGKALQYLCHTCKVALCQECQHTFHKMESHDLVELYEEQAHQSQNETLVENNFTEDGLQSIAKQEEELEQQTTDVLRDIKRWADEIRTEVLRQEESLTKDVVDHYSMIQNQLQQKQYKSSRDNQNGIRRQESLRRELSTRYDRQNNTDKIADQEVLIFSANKTVMEELTAKGFGYLTRVPFNPNREIDLALNRDPIGVRPDGKPIEYLHFKKKISIGGNDDPATKLILPLGVAMTTKGEVLAADTLRGVVVLNRHCDYVRHFSATDDEEEFEPRDIHAINEKEVAITDIEKCQVVVCDIEGKKKFDFGESTLTSPLSVANSKTGRLFVTDIQSHCIFIYDRNGRYLKKFGSYGSGDGQFKFPWAVVVTSMDDVIVSDYYNHRIQVFDLEGRFKFSFGSHGKAVGEFEYPRGLALDQEDNIYVCSNHKVQVFTMDGVFLGCLGDNDDALWYVTGITVSPRMPHDVMVTHHSEQSLMSSSVITVFGL